jgi:ATP-dependent helicase STH1/SNF2
MKITRLITEDELPDWLKNDVEQVEKTLENYEDFGKGRRQRKDIDYSDNLTEREFLQALEEGNLDDALEQKRIRKQNRKNLSSSQDNDIDLDETEACSSFDNPPSISQINQQNISSKRGSVKKRLETVDPKIAPQCRLLLDHLLAYRTDDDRQLAQIFIRLPGQKQLPLYYQIIQEPIDFQRIRRKIDTYRYSNLEQFNSDIKLLVENAQTFNCETSIIYSDSILLGKVYQNLFEQLQSGLLQIPTETNIETDETTATSRVSSRQKRGTRTTTTTTKKSVTTNSEVPRRGLKRKATVSKEEDNVSEDEQVVSDDGDNQED